MTSVLFFSAATSTTVCSSRSCRSVAVMLAGSVRMCTRRSRLGGSDRQVGLMVPGAVVSGAVGTISGPSRAAAAGASPVAASVEDVGGYGAGMDEWGPKVGATWIVIAELACPAMQDGGGLIAGRCVGEIAVERAGSDEAHLIARRLAAAGTPVSRRTLRSNGARGSNAWLGALARMVNAELAGATAANRAGPPG
jgi:hypothetical protein